MGLCTVFGAGIAVLLAIPGVKHAIIEIVIIEHQQMILDGVGEPARLRLGLVFLACVDGKVDQPVHQVEHHGPGEYGQERFHVHAQYDVEFNGSH